MHDIPTSACIDVFVHARLAVKAVLINYLLKAAGFGIDPHCDHERCSAYAFSVRRQTRSGVTDIRAGEQYWLLASL